MSPQLQASEPRLVLHIGTKKTGTTALQSFLVEHRRELTAAGVGLVDIDALVDKTNIRWKHHELALVIRRLPRSRAKRNELFSEVKRQMRRATRRGRHLIVSSEMFSWQARPAAVRAALGDVETEVLCYLRPPADYAETLYRNFVMRGRNALSMADWLEQPDCRTELDYGRLTRRWDAAFGANRVHVRPYHRAFLVGGSTPHDACSWLGVDTRFAPPSFERHPTLTAIPTAFMAAALRTARLPTPATGNGANPVRRFNATKETEALRRALLRAQQPPARRILSHDEIESITSRWSRGQGPVLDRLLPMRDVDDFLSPPVETSSLGVAGYDELIEVFAAHLSGRDASVHRAEEIVGAPVGAWLDEAQSLLP